jgi:hypothetical protein
VKSWSEVINIYGNHLNDYAVTWSEPLKKFKCLANSSDRPPDFAHWISRLLDTQGILTSHYFFSP